MKLPIYVQILQNSLTSIKRYNHLLLLRNSTIFWYFVTWITVLSLLQAIQFSIVTIPELFTGLSHSIAEATEYYPDDLVLHWNGVDTISSSIDRFDVYYPSGFDADRYTLPANLGTYITTDSDPDLTEYSKNFFLATPHHLYLQEASGDWNTFEFSTLLSDTPEGSLNKSDVRVLNQVWLDQKEYLQQVAQVAGGLIRTVSSIASKTVTLLFRALFVLMIAKYLARIQTNYKRSLKLAALLTVPAIIVETCIIYLYGADIYGLSGFTFWMLFTLYLWFGKVTIKQVKRS